VATSIVLVAPIGWASLGFLGAFILVQAAYSMWLKHEVLVDVMTIAALFVLRASTGAVAHVRILLGSSLYGAGACLPGALQSAAPKRSSRTSGELRGRYSRTTRSSS
jgi:4-hydroxybenzoate polyprenyltransferase